METMTITKNKRYAMKQAQRAYAMAKAFNDLNTQIDLEARQEELNAFDYPFAEEWKSERRNLGEFIKDPKIDYLMKDSFCDEYYHAIYERRVKKGWPVPKSVKVEPYYHITADAESFKLLKMAENVLIDCVLSTVPEYLAKDLERAKGMYHERIKLINIAMRWDTNN